MNVCLQKLLIVVLLFTQLSPTMVFADNHADQHSDVHHHAQHDHQQHDHSIFHPNTVHQVSEQIVALGNVAIGEVETEYCEHMCHPHSCVHISLTLSKQLTVVATTLKAFSRYDEQYRNRHLSPLLRPPIA